jgi:hypothetical protein
MSLMYVEQALAAWLLVSVFALGHTPLSATISVIVAIAVGALAWGSLRKPAIRYVNSAITLMLAACAVLLPGLSAAARINTAIVALVLLALSAVSPVHGHAIHGHPQAAGPAGTRPPGPD